MCLLVPFLCCKALFMKEEGGRRAHSCRMQSQGISPISDIDQDVPERTWGWSGRAVLALLRNTESAGDMVK